MPPSQPQPQPQPLPLSPLCVDAAVQLQPLVSAAASLEPQQIAAHALTEPQQAAFGDGFVGKSGKKVDVGATEDGDEKSEQCHGVGNPSFCCQLQMVG